MRLRKYAETLALVMVMLLVGGGIHLLQVNGVLLDEDLSGSVAFAQDSLNIATSQLEQIGRITHDYLNGYLSGPSWGTALPEEVMIEEIEQLYFRYQLVKETVDFLYPQGASINLLLNHFSQGFTNATEGLKNHNQNSLKQAHEIFHQIDYEVFNHKLTDEIYVRD